MSWSDCYQLQLVDLTMEHHPARNLQCETSPTTFDCSPYTAEVFYLICISLCLFVVQSLSFVRLFATPKRWTAAHQAPLSFTTSQSFLKFMSIESVMPPKLLIRCHLLLLLPSIFPSIRVFSSGSSLHISCPKYWSFSFSISPSSEYSALISLRIDWFDLFAVQGTLRCLL